jgi:hypothetical protein
MSDLRGLERESAQQAPGTVRKANVRDAGHLRVYSNLFTNDVARVGLAAAGENASKMTRRSGHAV